MTPYNVFTLDERPELIDAVDEVASAGWPEFMLHATVANEYFGYLYNDLKEFQVVLVDENEAIMAVGNTIPFVWDGTTEGLPLDGWDAVMTQGVTNHQNGIKPNTLSAVQAVVAPNHLGKGLSQHVLQAMKSVAMRHGFKALVAPVRPNLKHRYPLTPMERYIQWKQVDGSPFDPWMRTHWKIGAEIVRVCPRSMTIPGTVSDWEEWTEMRFPESGSYIVPGALVPVEIDREADMGRYIEPNVWMRHPVDPK